MKNTTLILVALFTLMLSGLTNAQALNQKSSRGLGFLGGILYIFEEKDSEVTKKLWEIHEMWGGEKDLSYNGVEVLEMYVVDRYQQEVPTPGTLKDYEEETRRASELGDLVGEARLYQEEFQRNLRSDLVKFFEEETNLAETYKSVEKKLSKMKKSYCAVSTAKCESINLAIKDLKAQAKAKFLWHFETSNRN